MNPIRVVLVEDQPIFRQGLRFLLERHADIRVVGEAADGAEASTLISATRPQVALMDLRMPKIDGVQATGHIRQRYAFCRVLVLTTFDDDELVFSALQAGASGYLLKDADHETLAAAIRAVARGETVLQPVIATKVVSRLNEISAPKAGEAALPEALTSREREILRLLAAGMSNKQIGHRLSLAEGTVKNYMTNILAKLDVTDRTQAVIKATRIGLA
jgi:DNA-binding NarL/FixJ family response regulator